MATYMAGTTTMAAPQYAYAAPTVMETMAAPQVMYETMAAPQYAASYAAPQVMYETMAAPQYAASYAAPQMTYAAAPQMVEYAAPQVTYAAPQYTTQVPSFVAPPAFAPMQQAIMAPQVPMQPPKLTEGIPTPDQIAKQKAGYAAALDKQLKEAIETVRKETEIEKQMVAFTAEKNIALHAMQVDEQLTEAVALTDEQSIFALLELNKAKVERGLQLNNQANGLVMDYQMKAVQTELAQKQYAFQQEYMKAENVLAQQYNNEVAKAHTGTTYSTPAQAVV